MLRSVFVAALIGAAAADWCVSSWHPRMCVEIADGASPSTDDGCVNGYYETFDSEDSCNPNPSGGAVSGAFCVTSWEPLTCGLTAMGQCVTGYSTGFDSLTDCQDNAEMPSINTTEAEVDYTEIIDGDVCVFNWWPRLCSFTSTGFCAPGYTVGYDTIEECESHGAEAPSVTNFTELVDGDVCVFNWFPRVCSFVSTGFCVEGYTVGYDTMEECMAEGTAEFGVEEVDGDVCITSWWPRTCNLTLYDECVPGYTVGYDSVDECMAEGGYTEVADVEVNYTEIIDGDVCVFNWWPRLCSFTSTGFCAAGYTIGYDTIEECEAEGGWVEDAEEVNYTEIVDGDVCVFNWWPRLCAYTSTGFCAAGYTVGYDTIEECEAAGTAVSEVEQVVDGDVCVFNWWPRLCSFTATGFCAPGYTVGYDTIEECEAAGYAGGEVAMDDVLTISGDYCVSSWFPRACDMTNSSNCVTGYYVGFDSMEECMGEMAVEDVEEDLIGMWCKTAWWPVECGQYGNATCLFGSTTMYDTEFECLGLTEEPTPTAELTGYCLSQWWPKVCVARSSGDCVVSSPTYETMEECDPAPAVEDTDSMYCITQWWPLECGMAGESDCRGGSAYYDTMLECNPNYVDPAAVMNVMEVAVDGYCVSQWWPKTCALVSSGSCAGWYPDNGYETEAECLAK